MSQINIEAITHELHTAFNIFNEKYFNGEIPETAITIQSSSHQRSAMGWCTTKPVWGDRTGKIQMYEINISAEYLDLDFFETMDTLLHEMIHLFHRVNGIKDTSRNNTYHNKHFRDKALELGFEYASNKPDSMHGWTYARLGQAAIEEIGKLDIDKSIFIISRRGSAYFQQVQQLQLENTDGEKEELSAEEIESIEYTPLGRETVDIMERKPSSFKWVCSSCKISVRSTRQVVNIVCGDCNEPFKRVN